MPLRITALAPFAMVLAALFSAATWAQQPAPASLTVRKVALDSVVVNLSGSIRLNDGSSLKREGFVLTDPAAPAVLDGMVTPRVVYDAGGRYSSGSYEYRLAYSIKPLEPIVAWEVRTLVIDVFGKSVTTLTTTEVTDLAMAYPYSAGWRILSETDAKQAFAFVTYIARVRTAAGKFYEIDRRALLTQLRTITASVSEADMDPKK